MSRVRVSLSIHIYTSTSKAEKELLQSLRFALSCELPDTVDVTLLKEYLIWDACCSRSNRMIGRKRSSIVLTAILYDGVIDVHHK